MPKVSLSGMTVEALMDLRKRLDETLHKHRAELQKQLERIASFHGETVARRRWAKCKRIEGQESPAKISGSERGDLGRTRCTTTLARCRDQRRKKA